RTSVQAIQEAGGTATFFSTDASVRTSLQDLADHSQQFTGCIDVLVNCAGVNSAAPYLEITDDDWHRVVAGNLTATHLACQVFGGIMTAQALGGSILNIGSVTADVPLSRVFAYSASKAAVVNLTKNLAREWAGKRVRVNALCPGFFPAEQNKNILDSVRTENILRNTPLGRFGEPSELVPAAILLCSRSAGSFITGADYYVDGGFTGMRF
ncbi:MAG: SDR family oxidoreductase, partial [Planctomycetota bacterium]|nr:SDR family oxidoreductase [Planctomycetota bacterium]